MTGYYKVRLHCIVMPRNFWYPVTMNNVIQVDSSVLGGTPVFKDTRVPIQNLFDYIEGDETVDEFLTDFPTVTKNQVIQLLEQLKNQALERNKAA